MAQPDNASVQRAVIEKARDWMRGAVQWDGGDERYWRGVLNWLKRGGFVMPLDWEVEGEMAKKRFRIAVEVIWGK